MHKPRSDWLSEHLVHFLNLLNLDKLIFPEELRNFGLERESWALLWLQKGSKMGVFRPKF